MSALETRDVGIPGDYRGHNEAVHGEQKSELRQRFIAARRALPQGEIALAQAAVCAAVLRRCGESGWRCVAAYEPMRTEPGSVELLAGLSAAGVDVLVPTLLADKDLDWTIWSPSEDGARASLGVDAIARADAVLVPALAVAADGTRLGRGGGSYDRALGRVAGIPIAALLYPDEVIERLPADPWDRRVTAVVTPAGWRELPRA
jgi:5-formyltetrahydrofolate cyclo-ligase